MLMTLFNLGLAIAGSLALALAVFILIDQPLRCMLSRQWLRQRLGKPHVLQPLIEPPSTQHFVSGNLTHDAAITDDTANFLDAVGREMNLGSSVTAAFLHSYHAFPLLADYIRPIAESCERGVSLTEVIRTCEVLSSSTTMPSSVVFGVRALWAATTGSTGAMALERAAATLRERTAIKYERHVQSAQARISVQVLTWLPIAFLGWQFITNPLARWFLLASPTGWVFLGGGLGLNWYGRRWMNRVVRGTLP